MSLSGNGDAPGTYGQLPGWLPRAKVRVDRVMQATRARPRLAIQGDSVAVSLPRGHALVTTVGPEVPETGEFPVPLSSPCTFTVTFTAIKGAVRLDAGAFTILDELGHVHHPHVTNAEGHRLPTILRAGTTYSLRVRDVLPTGGGRLRWAPEGTRPIASWDFDVEID